MLPVLRERGGLYSPEQPQCILRGGGGGGHEWPMRKQPVQRPCGCVPVPAGKAAGSKHARSREHLRRWTFASKATAIALCPSNVCSWHLVRVFSSPAWKQGTNRAEDRRTAIHSLASVGDLPETQWLTDPHECAFPSPPAFLSVGTRSRETLPFHNPQAGCNSLGLPMEQIPQPHSPKKIQASLTGVSREPLAQGIIASFCKLTHGPSVNPFWLLPWPETPQWGCTWSRPSLHKEQLQRLLSGAFCLPEAMAFLVLSVP